MLLHFFSSVVDRVWILDQSFALLVLHYEFLHTRDMVSDDENLAKFFDLLLMIVHPVLALWPSVYF